VKNYILQYNNEQIINFLQSINEPAYRSKQIFEAIYAHNKDSFDEFTTLPLNTRQILKEHFILRSLKKIDEITSQFDGTRKFLWQLSDGYKIESVIIYQKKRVTFCISSQVGCALDCKFCATGKMGILRNLNSGEIVEQVLQMQTIIDSKPSNIVFMGMGEPMLNYDAVINASKILTDPSGIGLGKRRVTVSTSGVIPGIEKFINEKQPYSLAISLNSIDDEIRTRIMPISKKYPIEALIKAAKDYTEQSGRLITFEYVLIDKYNASLEDAKRLVQLTHRVPCKINVIPCNSTESDYLPPSREKVREFENYVNKRSRRITIRQRKGWEIQAACGQLYAKNEKIKKHITEKS
jgi:23S rRNA (adenine2503-C2)-methyltransferase